MSIRAGSVTVASAIENACGNGGQVATPADLRRYVLDAGFNGPRDAPGAADAWHRQQLAEDWLSDHSEDLALLCAEMGEALDYQISYLLELFELTKDAEGPLLGPLAAMYLGLPEARAALAKLSELEAR